MFLTENTSSNKQNADREIFFRRIKIFIKLFSIAVLVIYEMK